MKKVDVDLRSLSISDLIAHDIPKRRKSDAISDIPLSESVPPLPQPTLEFFTARLRGTLVKRGQIVEVDPKIEGAPLPGAIEQWLRTRGDVVALSQLAARHLYAVQVGSASEGILAMSPASVEGSTALALMKLPHEAGLRVKRMNIDGKATLTIELLGDLTLTENTRVFKAGLFWLHERAMVGVVSDDQTGEPCEIADFFLAKFLGLRRMKRPAVQTKAFRDTVIEFITKTVDEEAQKLDYFNALNVELRSHARKIEPIEFVRRHFHLRYREPLLKALAARGVSQSAFPKSTDLLPQGGRKARLKTNGGLTIAGDADAMERVKAEVVDGKQAIVIRDTLRSVG